MYADDFGAMVFTIIVLLVVGLSLYAFIGVTKNVDYIQDCAEGYFENNGLEIVVNEGYQRSAAWTPVHGGGIVWYQVKRTDNPDVIYRCYLKRNGKNNIQMWDLSPIGKYIVFETEGHPVVIVE